MIVHRLFVLLLLNVLAGPLGNAAAEQAGEQPDIEVFVRQGCPHCEAAKTFLYDLQHERPALHIARYDIAENSSARQRLAMLAAERSITTIGVPAFLIGTELIVGFLSDDTTGAEIRARLNQNAQVAAVARLRRPRHG